MLGTTDRKPCNVADARGCSRGFCGRFNQDDTQRPMVRSEIDCEALGKLGTLKECMMRARELHCARIKVAVGTAGCRGLECAQLGQRIASDCDVAPMHRVSEKGFPLARCEQSH